MMTKQELIDFEYSVAHNFNRGHIRAPVHLSGGNEDQLLEVFQQVKPHDWIFSTWRSHYHALLHGVTQDVLMEKVLKGMSISINVPERRFYSSAICGGCLPMALGVAWAEKRRRDGCSPDMVGWHDRHHVWCFVGDMAAEMGCFHEATKYAANFDLPITFVVEDNGKCVNADTGELWGGSFFKAGVIPPSYMASLRQRGKVVRYGYKLSWPHMGTGRFIEFADKQEFAPTGGM